MCYFTTTCLFTSFIKHVLFLTSLMMLTIYWPSSRFSPPPWQVFGTVTVYHVFDPFGYLFWPQKYAFWSVTPKAWSTGTSRWLISLQRPAGTVKLANLGSALWSAAGHRHNDPAGSLTNLSPKGLPEQPGQRETAVPFTGRPVDVWASGVTLLNLRLASHRGRTLQQLFANIRRGTLSEEAWGLIVNQEGGVGSWSLRAALIHMFEPQPERRCSALDASRMLHGRCPSHEFLPGYHHLPSCERETLWKLVAVCKL